MLALCTMLSAQAALAAPRSDDGGSGWRSAFERVKHLVVKVLDTVTDASRIGLPPG